MAKTSLSKSTGAVLPWLGLALILLIADQFTKVLILGYYQLGDSTLVTSFFNIVRVHNSGAAFSFLASASGWQRWFFTAVGVGAAVFIIYMLRSHPGQKLFSFLKILLQELKPKLWDYRHKITITLRLPMNQSLREFAKSSAASMKSIYFIKRVLFHCPI